MIREPKTDRPLAIALVGVGYTVVTIARPGNTLAPPAYSHIQMLFGTEQHFLWVAIAFLFVQTLALVTHGLPRLVACLVLIFASWAFGVLIFQGSTVALLPGLALMVFMCNGLALFDSFRMRWHP